MKIRTQLALLVAAVVVPVALLAGATTARLWSLQREAYEERFLERVSGLRLALDAQLQSTERTMVALSGSAELDLAQQLPRFLERVGRLLASNPSWSTIGVFDETGRQVAAATRNGLRAIPPPQPPADMSAGADFSDLRALGDGTYITYASVPIVRDGVRHGFLYIGISHLGWLDFLRSYPISRRATLTLTDRSGVVVARTLDDERWVGKRSNPLFLEHLAGRDEGSFQITGIEGQRFYVAFSRSRHSKWVLSTGVPRDDVEADLRQSTTAIVGGVAITALAVAMFAIWLGSRIIGAMTVLQEAARAIATPGAKRPEARLDIDEAETVRVALNSAGERLAAREHESSATLLREAEARAEAERANAAKDEFLAMLGHELRNPLSAMKSAAALLAMPAARAAVHERSRQVIDRQINRLTDLVDDMLDVARLNAGKIVLDRKLVDLAEVVRHVVAAFKDAGRSMHVRIATDLAPAWVFADETRLEQIVANLLDNACKYTPTGGMIRIATASADDGVHFDIADSGAGIAPDFLPRIFDVFTQGMRTLERAEGGLGLGLTVVRRLVTLHGGSVVASSEGVGRGAAFHVILPAPSGVERRSGMGANNGEGITPLRIVVVEDNDDNRELTRLLLDFEGHAVIATGDGETGVQTILDTRPDVALVDIGLPGIDGFEVARRVLASASQPPTLLVALTGYGTPEDRERALDAGFDAFLVKPFDLGAFAGAVVTSLARRAAAKRI